MAWTSKSWPFLVQVSYCIFIARLFFGAAAVVANSEELSGDDGLLAGGGRALGAARGAGCAAGALGSCREGLKNWAGVSGRSCGSLDHGDEFDGGQLARQRGVRVRATAEAGLQRRTEGAGVWGEGLSGFRGGLGVCGLGQLAAGQLL